MKIGIQMMAVLAAGMASAASLEREGTCGVYSPDGSRILCARAVEGKSRLVLIEKDGQEKLVETGPGHAAFPAWYPSGEGFVYTYGNETKSAWRAFQEKSATGFHLRYRTLAGVDRELTTGRCRDSMPGFSPDGKTLYFASTRCAEPEVFKASKTGLYSMPFDGGEPTCLLPARVNCQAYGQPAVSPDGRYLVWAEMDGFSDGWHLNLAKRDRLDVVHRLTPPLQSAYAPRWSPDGRTIVYTGFLPDDPGWCVYAIDPRSGRYERLCEGRNPDVYPSGGEILYDDGTSLHTRAFSGKVERGIAQDSDGTEMFTGPVEVLARFGHGERVPRSEAMDQRFVFGAKKTFYVRAKVKYVPGESRFRHFVTGSYEGAPLGFELFTDGAEPKFGIRYDTGLYCGIHGAKPMQEGREYDVCGVRTRESAFLFVDGHLMSEVKFFGTYSLDKPIQVNFGPTIKEQGMLLEAEVGTGYPRDLPRPATRRDIFGDEAVAPVPAPFAKIAYVDSFDYPTVLETETAEGSRRILDIVLKTGATTVLWRNQSGAVPRYPSKEESLPLKEPPLDKRRIPLSEPIRGWTRFDDCGTDLIRAAADECAKRDVAFGIHLTTEENHGESWTLSPWNLEHPQFWSRRKNAAPWVGRCSHAFPEVRAHKLRLVDELLAYQPTMIYLDLCRSGGWTPSLEYVKPVVDAWQARYGAELPDWKDPRWLRLVEEMYEPYYRGIREHLDKTGRSVELVMAIERAGAKEDWNMVNRAVDWRKLLRTGVVDAVAVACIEPDWTDPWGSTMRIYRGIVDEVKAIGRGKVYFPIMSYNFTGRPGYPEYAKRLNVSQAEAVKKLLECARDAGGAGITMEVVDAGNYSPEVCAVIRAFEAGATR